MRVWQIARPGSIDGLELTERDRPRPGPHQVLVRVRATSLNYRDLMVAKGAYARGGVAPGLIPLSDGAGEVAEIGPGVARVREGDRVAAIFMQRWLAGELTSEGSASALGGAIDGMLAEYVLLHEDGLVHLPAHLSFEEGATLPCAAVTAWHALVSFGQVKAGDTVLVLGTGGVSVFALQFARMHGARVIATSSSDTKLAQAREMGAAEGVNYRAMPEWQEEVARLTDGRGVDHVVEVGGPGTLARSMEAVRVCGKIALIGVLTGNAEVNPLPIMRKTLSVQGVYVGSRAMFEAMNRAIAESGMRPVIDRVVPFDSAPDAYRHMEGASHFGKVVIQG